MIPLQSVIVTFAGEDIRRRRVSKVKTFNNGTSVRVAAMIKYGSTRSVLIRIFHVELIISKVG